MLALSTVQAAVFDVPHLCRVATRQHLGHQVLRVGRLVAWMGVLKRLPVIAKDLLKDTPVSGGCCKHPRPPSEGDGIVTVPWLYHGSSALSTPPQQGRSLNLSQFVARQYWRKRWATRYRFRVHSVE